MPFYSSEWIDEQNGTSTELPWPKTALIDRGIDLPGKAKYYCFRSSINGKDVHQLCDRNTTGNSNVVRDAAQAFMDGLKEGHFIDFQSRFMVITLNVHSVNAELASQVRFMFEFPPEGGVLPST